MNTIATPLFQIPNIVWVPSYWDIISSFHSNPKPICNTLAGFNAPSVSSSSELSAIQTLMWNNENWFRITAISIVILFLLIQKWTWKLLIWREMKGEVDLCRISCSFGIFGPDLLCENQRCSYVKVMMFEEIMTKWCNSGSLKSVQLKAIKMSQCLWPSWLSGLVFFVGAIGAKQNLFNTLCKAYSTATRIKKKKLTGLDNWYILWIIMIVS